MAICNAEWSLLHVSLDVHKYASVNDSEFKNLRYNQRAAGRSAFPADLLRMMKAEVRTADSAACKDEAGRWRCPFCPNWHFRRQDGLDEHFEYHKRSPIPAPPHKTCQGMVVATLAKKDKVLANVMALTGSGPLPDCQYLIQSAEIIRRHVGAASLGNTNAVTPHSFLGEDSPRISN